ncbi:phage holin family protein [Dysosmobacter sp.]
MNAVQMKNAVIGALAVVGSAITQAMGGWDVTLKVLVGFMAVDYMTGILVAAVWHKSSKSETGALESNACFKGLLKKMMILLIVWMAAMLDRATGSEFVRTAVCLFYIGNEGLSILENSVIMGVPWPNAIKNVLEVMRKQGDTAKEAQE